MKFNGIFTAMNVFEISLIGFLLFQGLLLSFLFFRKKPYLCNALMGMLILRYSLLMMNLLFEDSDIYFEIPIPMYLTGPLILLYIRKSRDGGMLRIADWLLFLPVSLNLISFSPAGSSFMLIQPFFDIVWTVSLSAAAFAAAVKWKNVRKEGWYLLMPMLVLISSIVSGMDLIFLLIGRMGISDFFSSFMALLEGGLIFVPAWHVLYRDRAGYLPGGERKILSEPAVKYQKNLLDESLLEIYHKKIKDGMDNEDWYKQPGLSLAQLSELVSIPVVHLSQVINRMEGVNFYQYLNRLRIDEVCRLLEMKPDSTILEAMYDAGFKSKSTFNTAFRALTGKTPKEYRLSLAEEG